MTDNTTDRTPAGHLLCSMTQAHHDVLGAMLRADVILLPSQRQWVCKALDALRTAHGARVEAGDMRTQTQGAHP